MTSVVTVLVLVFLASLALILFVAANPLALVAKDNSSNSDSGGKQSEPASRK